MELRHLTVKASTSILMVVSSRAGLRMVNHTVEAERSVGMDLIRKANGKMALQTVTLSFVGVKRAS